MKPIEKPPIQSIDAQLADGTRVVGFLANYDDWSHCTLVRIPNADPSPSDIERIPSEIKIIRGRYGVQLEGRVSFPLKYNFDIETKVFVPPMGGGVIHVQSDKLTEEVWREIQNPTFQFIHELSEGLRKQELAYTNVPFDLDSIAGVIGSSRWNFDIPFNRIASRDF